MFLLNVSFQIFRMYVTIAILTNTIFCVILNSMVFDCWFTYYKVGTLFQDSFLHITYLYTKYVIISLLLKNVDKDG